jgi:stalled ribosome alternative rescue factor ArfA
MRHYFGDVEPAVGSGPEDKRGRLLAGGLRGGSMQNGTSEKRLRAGALSPARNYLYKGFAMKRSLPRIRRNPVARAVRTPTFRPRVVRDKKKYNRKEKHRPTRHLENVGRSIESLSIRLRSHRGPFFSSQRRKL